MGFKTFTEQEWADFKTELSQHIKSVVQKEVYEAVQAGVLDTLRNVTIDPTNSPAIDTVHHELDISKAPQDPTDGRFDVASSYQSDSSELSADLKSKSYDPNGKRQPGTQREAETYLGHIKYPVQLQGKEALEFAKSEFKYRKNNAVALGAEWEEHKF